MNVELFNKNVKLAFTAVLVLAISQILLPFVDLLGGAQSVANSAGAGSGSFWVIVRWLVNIAYLAGVAGFCYVMFMLKDVVEGSAKEAVNLVFIGAAIATGAAILDFFLGGILMALIGIGVAVVYLLGYNKMKVAAELPDTAKAGAGLCSIAAILMLIGAVLCLIPLLGAIINFILLIPAYIILILGWKKAVVA